jgi:hypothetical protein
LACIFLGLIQVAAPFTTIGNILVNFEPVPDAFYFKHPFLFADATLNNRVSRHFCFHLPG